MCAKQVNHPKIDMLIDCNYLPLTKVESKTHTESKTLLGCGFLKN